MSGPDPAPGGGSILGSCGVLAVVAALLTSLLAVAAALLALNG